jgi:hypothetical protein
MTYPSLLISNAYNVLGLDSTTPSSEVRKRAQLLLQLAKINEIERFETDIGDISQIRKIPKIRDALEKLSGIKDRLQETFFWFEIQASSDRNVLKLIAQKKHEKAIDVLEKSRKSDWLGQKNLALCLMFTVFSKKDISNPKKIVLFRRSLDIWKKLIDSEAFWTFYKKYYLLHEEIGTSRSLFTEFRNEITTVLAKLSSELYCRMHDPEILKLYYEFFGSVDGSLDTEILQPIVSKIKESVNEIYEHATSSKAKKKPTLKSLLKDLSTQYVELCKFELCDYSPIAVLKNNVAEKLRSASVSIYNQDDDHDLAIFILQHAEKFASSDDVQEKIQNDKKTILANQRWDNSIGPKIDKIQKLIEGNKLSEAYHEYLDFDKGISNPDNFWENSDHVKLLLLCCGAFIQKGNHLRDNESYSEAAEAFYYPYEILLDRLQLFNFYSLAKNRNALKELLISITQKANECEWEEIKMLFEKIEQEAERHEDENLKTAIEFLGGAAIHRALCKRIKTAKEKNIWKWISWGAVILFLIIKNS